MMVKGAAVLSVYLIINILTTVPLLSRCDFAIRYLLLQTKPKFVLDVLHSFCFLHLHWNFESRKRMWRALLSLT